MMSILYLNLLWASDGSNRRGVVEVTTGGCMWYYLVSVLELLEGLGDARDDYKRKLKKGVHSTKITYIITYLSYPSETVHSPLKWPGYWEGRVSHLHLNELPTAVFKPRFATLQRKLENLEEINVSRSDVDCAAKYLRSAVKFYKDPDSDHRAD